MKIFTTLCLLTVVSSNSLAMDPMAADMRRIMDSFDNGRGAAMPRVRPPSRAIGRLGAPVDASRWAPVPELRASAPFSGRPEETVDALSGLEACAAADAVYIRQPTLAEAAKALAPCLEAVSKRYGAAALVYVQGQSLLIRIPVTAAGGPLHRDLAKSLESREAKLYGQPVELKADLAAFAPRGTSVLQPVLDRCAGPKMLPTDAADFVAVYADCLGAAKGLEISGVRAHHSEPRTVIVYSAVRPETLRDISGTVSVPARGGPFRIEARSELTPVSSSR
ncbi:MAG: hypothetical protein HYZ75_16085 [Elusimicrobia bacterium]|nr:hypothetical protein [Elusimicrobiota bacterium]